ncbi:MAG: glycosyltransferase family 39 protein [Candidatus Omnitrophica bacterium]|nr:glycosyltransferase family 39 protein [Candidatus Omnitrophota bacterium]
MNTKIFTLVTLLFILTGSIFLRLYKIGDKPVWFDETVSISHAEKPLDFYLTSPRVNYKPVYFFLLNRWLYLFGEDAFNLRLFSLICGVLNILFIFKLASLLFNEETGLLSAFLLGISVFHIYQCQQIRQFSFIALLATAAVYYLTKFYKTGRIVYLGLLLAINILLINTYPTGFLVVMAEGIFAALYLRGILLRKWIFSFIPLALFAGLWFLNSDKSHMKEMAFWISKPGLKSIVETFNTLSWGGPRYGLDDFKVTFAAPWLMWIFSLGYFVLILFGFYSAKATRKADDKRAKVLLSLWLVIPVLFTYLYSQMNDFSIYAIKHFIIILPAFCISVAVGFLCFSHKVKIVIISSICLLSFIPLSIVYNNSFSADWKNSTEYVSSLIAEGDAVVVSSLSEVVTFMFYFDKKKHTLQDFDIYGKISRENYKNNVFLAGRNNQIIGIKLGDKNVDFESDLQEKIMNNSAIKKKRVWTMISRSTYPPITLGVIGFMERNFRKRGCRSFRGVEVRCFDPLVIKNQ